MRVLIVTSRFPLPPWRGNQVRTVEWLRALEGWDCGLVCPTPPTRSGTRNLARITEHVWQYRSSPVQAAGGIFASVAAGRPAQEGLYTAGTASRVVTEAVKRFRPEVVVVQMVRSAWAADVVVSAAPKTALLFDAIDAMGLHFARAARSVAPPLRFLYRAEAARCRRREEQLAARADRVTAVCARDLEALAAPASSGKVVPVSARAFVRSNADPARPTILLSGNLGYRPTVVGAQWFAANVWPQLVQRVAGVKWLLVGSRPHRAVRRLAESPGVELHTNVGDLEPYLAQATVAIAPLSSGSGIPMKVLEAWAAAVPVVADPWAVEGLDADGATAVEKASGPDEWVAALEFLLKDRDAARRLGDRGREMWASRYRFDRVADAVCEVVGEAAASVGAV